MQARHLNLHGRLNRMGVWHPMHPLRYNGQSARCDVPNACHSAEPRLKRRARLRKCGLAEQKAQGRIEHGSAMRRDVKFQIAEVPAWV